MIRLAWFALAVGLVISACGDNRAPSPDAAPTVVFEESAHGPPPQLVSDGGDVLASPRIQPIFWAGDDAMQATIEDFHAQLAKSLYWPEVTQEYGVGPLTVLPTIVTTDAPPTSQPKLEAWLASNLDGSHTATGWPAAVDDQTIYAVYLPAGAMLSGPGGTSCADYGAYHDEIVTSGTSIVYALMPRCDYGDPIIDDLTSAASHEFVEAATDPRFETLAAYGDADPANYVMAYTPGAEAGDYCELVDSAYYRAFGTYLVQRIWSNAASMAGKNPCVPAMDGAYVAAVPMFAQTASLPDYYGNPIKTQGISVATGASATVDVQLVSNTPTVPFTLDVADANELFGEAPELKLSLDQTSGVNGDVVHLTVSRLKAGQLPGSEFVIEASLGDTVVSQWWGFVANGT